MRLDIAVPSTGTGAALSTTFRGGAAAGFSFRAAAWTLPVTRIRIMEVIMHGE